MSRRAMLRWPNWWFGWLALVIWLTACGGGESPSSEASIGSQAAREEAPTEGAAGDEAPRFFDVTAASGVDWTHNNGAFGERWMPETLGPGVVVLDIDGDQRLDLLFINGRNFPGHPGDATLPALYRNLGDWRFENITAEAGLEMSIYCLGGAAADIDNDDDVDVFLSCVGQDLLFRNDDGRFVDISRSAGLVETYEHGTSAAFFDADHDGLVDLYVTRYVQWTPETDIPCQLYGDSKSYCTAAVYPGAPGRFYRNLGDGVFADQTREAGLYQADARAMGVVPIDLDNDGWVDLAIACDSSPNLLYRNRGDGTFEEIGVLAGMAFSSSGQVRGGMGIDIGDYDRSGRSSLAISFFYADGVGIYRNLGDRFFVDEANLSEVGRSTYYTVGWGIFFFDFDLDGWLDLLVANGHIDEQAEAFRAQAKFAQPQQLFRNQGEGRFVEVTDSIGGDLAHPMVGRGAAFGDFDDDGDLDLVVTANNGPARLFENRGESGHYLRLALRGTSSNRQGLGARVEVVAGGATQTWLVRAGGSYLSQSQVEPTFGLGATERVDEVVVRWPSGVVQRLSGVAVDQRLEIVEPAT